MRMMILIGLCLMLSISLVLSRILPASLADKKHKEEMQVVIPKQTNQETPSQMAEPAPSLQAQPVTTTPSNTYYDPLEDDWSAAPVQRQQGATVQNAPVQMAPASVQTVPYTPPQERSNTTTSKTTYGTGVDPSAMGSSSLMDIDPVTRPSKTIQQDKQISQLQGKLDALSKKNLTPEQMVVEIQKMQQRGELPNYSPQELQKLLNNVQQSAKMN